jgi:hypothetical protein
MQPDLQHLAFSPFPRSAAPHTPKKGGGAATARSTLQHLAALQVRQVRQQKQEGRLRWNLRFGSSAREMD